MDSIIVFLLAAYLNISSDSAVNYYKNGWHLPDTTHMFNTAWVEHQAHVLNTKEPTYQKGKKFPMFYGKYSNYAFPCLGNKTSGFGKRWGKNHYGIDLGGAMGDPIYLSFDGVVRYAKYNYGGYGNLVVVRHYNGLETYYAHLSKINVKTGMRVKAGEIIGGMGSTGHSTGTHLHYEIRILGYPINPELLFSFTLKQILMNVYQINKSGLDLLKVESPFCKKEVCLNCQTKSEPIKEKKDLIILSPRKEKKMGNM